MKIHKTTQKIVSFASPCDLMFRPVQRLPSISLLLTDLLKHTQRALPTHPDCQELEKALAKIKEVRSMCCRFTCLKAKLTLILGDDPS